jgi:hypothetical protein
LIPALRIDPGQPSQLVKSQSDSYWRTVVPIGAGPSRQSVDSGLIPEFASSNPDHGSRSRKPSPPSGQIRDEDEDQF